MLKYLPVFILIFSVLMIAACSPIHTTPMKIYMLSDWKRTPTPSQSKTNVTLLVMTPTAAPGYQTAAMIYVLSPYELDAYTNNRWVASPAQMVMPMLVQALRDTGYFYAVVSPPFSGVTNLRLDTQILKLEQEFLLPISRIRFVMQASLLSNVSNRVVASRRFEVVIPSPQNNAYSGVLAANRAAKIMMQQVAQFMIRAIATLPKSQKDYRATAEKSSGLPSKTMAHTISWPTYKHL